MVGKRRSRLLVAVVMVLVSIPLMGCLGQWLAYEDAMNDDMGAAEAAAENAQQRADQGSQPEETAPSSQEEGALTGAQEAPATGPISSQEMAGTYSGSAVLQDVAKGVESADSLPVTMQLNAAGAGTANVNGYSGAAQYAGSDVSFSVTMQEDGQKVVCTFEGTASRSGGAIVIDGNMKCSMMGVTFASYSWTAQN
ncbi:MAG: hypothetical protein QMC79_08510 [Anaerosomatales bacterium]|nr:hypothetical protein [Anaerosomatales bacterium]